MLAHDAATALVTDVSGRFFDLYERTLVSRDAQDQMMATVLTTLVTSTATIQQSTARLLNAANTTMTIANGVEALERQEPSAPAVEFDTEDLAEKLAAVLTPPTETKTGKPWYVELLNGPLGTMAIQFLTNFVNGMMAAQQAAREAAPPGAGSPIPGSSIWQRARPGSTSLQTERATLELESQTGGHGPTAALVGVACVRRYSDPGLGSRGIGASDHGSGMPPLLDVIANSANYAAIRVGREKRRNPAPPALPQGCPEPAPEDSVHRGSTGQNGSTDLF
jgi:hypothetical protein